MERVKEDERVASCMVGGEGGRGHGRGARGGGDQRQLRPEIGTDSVLFCLSSLHVSRC